MHTRIGDWDDTVCFFPLSRRMLFLQVKIRSDYDK